MNNNNKTCFTFVTVAGNKDILAANIDVAIKAMKKVAYTQILNTYNEIVVPAGNGMYDIVGCV